MQTRGGDLTMEQKFPKGGAEYIHQINVAKNPSLPPLVAKFGIAVISNEFPKRIS